MNEKGEVMVKISAEKWVGIYHCHIVRYLLKDL